MVASQYKDYERQDSAKMFDQFILENAIYCRSDLGLDIFA